MTTFDDRQKAFEQKFAHDEELAFRIHARLFKLLGLWAAEKLGKQGVDAEEYAKEVVLADFELPGDEDVILKILKDLSNVGVSLSEKDIRLEIERLRPVARAQVMESKK